MSVKDTKETEVEEEGAERWQRPTLSMRAKLALGGLGFFTSMILIAGSGLPYLVSALQSIQQEKPTEEKGLVLLRVPVLGEILTYSLRKNISTTLEQEDRGLVQQSGTYSVEILQASNETKTYLQKQQGVGEGIAQTFNLTYSNDLRTYWAGGRWANETEMGFLSPLNLQLVSLHILPLPETELGMGDSWQLEHHDQGEEFGRQETIQARAEFTLRDVEEVETEAGRFRCYVVRGIWEGELVSTNISTGAEIGRIMIQAETVHWVESGRRFVVKAWETQELVSDGWSAKLWGAIMGYEDYRSLDYLEAEISMALVLAGRSVQEG